MGVRALILLLPGVIFFGFLSGCVNLMVQVQFLLSQVLLLQGEDAIIQTFLSTKERGYLMLKPDHLPFDL